MVDLLNSRDFKIQQRRRQQEHTKKTIGFISQQQLCMCNTLFGTFLCPFLHDYDVKMPNLVFYEDVNKQQ